MRDAQRRLSLNSKTVDRLSLDEVVELAADTGLEAVGLWRDRVQEAGVEQAARRVRGAGLRVSSLCRGGFLTASSPDGVRAALDDNERALDEAAALGAPELVMVVGGLPEGDRDLVAARHRVAERLDALAPLALARGVRLALEPLHPMFAADRAVLSTLEQALDLAAAHPPAAVGVVVDTFHVFWDPAAEESVARAGREGRISSYQVCDFNLPIAADALLSRGMMGDGVIDFAHWSAAVASAGYTGDVEVEIFNAEVWARDPDQVVREMKERYAALVAPHLAAEAPQPV
ncbi:sugar phosphate isomerase/epimerase [Phycicoccus sp. DTK01]|uniref:sugar phosphate isomerase/epimerase family protein n=1 Tax=Phycicoccus sp. DTK01 TaxID=2785745 RepID=UPI001A8CC880|nr:sugar phosphate isomerase/epimerase family protein [Phycicoccus sp. DTK01]